MATNHSCDSSVAIVQATRNSECVESIETSTHRWRRSDPAPVGRSVCVPHRIRDVRLCGALTLNARSGRERLGPTRAGGGDRDVDSATRGRAACAVAGVRGPVTPQGERVADVRVVGPTARRRGCLPMLLYNTEHTHIESVRFTHSDCNGSPIRDTSI